MIPNISTIFSAVCAGQQWLKCKPLPPSFQFSILLSELFAKKKKPYMLWIRLPIVKNLILDGVDCNNNFMMLTRQINLFSALFFIKLIKCDSRSF